MSPNMHMCLSLSLCLCLFGGRRAQKTDRHRRRMKKKEKDDDEEEEGEEGDSRHPSCLQGSVGGAGYGATYRMLYYYVYTCLMCCT